MDIQSKINQAVESVEGAARSITEKKILNEQKVTNKSVQKIQGIEENRDIGNYESMPINNTTSLKLGTFSDRMKYKYGNNYKESTVPSSPIVRTLLDPRNAFNAADKSLGDSIYSKDTAEKRKQRRLQILLEGLDDGNE